MGFRAEGFRGVFQGLRVFSGFRDEGFRNDGFKEEGSRDEGLRFRVLGRVAGFRFFKF